MWAPPPNDCQNQGEVCHAMAEFTTLATILLAEDESLLRELGETILCQAGYRVVTAPGAAELRLLLAEHCEPVDLLLTDVLMPGLSGQELVALARKRWPQVRVLYMSGYSNDEIELLDPEAGFLQKPFTPTELIEKIAKMLQPPSLSSAVSQA
jgi:two-component system cell cycle sensor histidine kinase/response regulator CckA